MICENCNGKGLVGTGESPKLLEGQLSVCSFCKGTGQINNIMEEEVKVEETETVEEEVEVSEEVEE